MHTDVGQKGEGSDYHFSAMEILNLYGTQMIIVYGILSLNVRTLECIC